MLFASVSMVAAADSLPHLVGKESNVTLSDMSPMLSWSPSASGPMDSTWNQTWTDASWADYTPLWPIVRMDDGRMPVSSHTTQYVGASVSLDFMGTAIYFFGTGKGSVSVDVGGKKSYIDVDLSAIGVIASVSGLDNAAQKASVTLKSGEISINSVIVTVQVGGQGYVLRLWWGDILLTRQCNHCQLDVPFVRRDGKVLLSWLEHHLVEGDDRRMEDE
jgi:hypothetical protein